MKRLIVLAVALSWVANFHAQNDKRLRGVEKKLNQILEDEKMAGFSVAVVDKNGIIYTKGFGYRDYENKTPVDANTMFAIGSTSKAFTSSLLGVLRKEGKLSFDDSPLDYIPGFSFYNDEMNSNIIIKDLMSHRTGLPRHDASWYMFPTASKDSMLIRVAQHEPQTGVRQQWIYNNFMFLAQGVIAEKVSGKSWEENLQQHIFSPLGMNRTNAVIEGLKSASNNAFGYETKDDGSIKRLEYYDISGMGPAGSINSTANDMGKWLITWLNDGQYKGQEILPADYVQEATSPQAITTLPRNLFANSKDIHLFTYGYGWLVSSYKGYYHVEHNGAIDGFTSHISFFPDAGVGVAVLTNQNGSTAATFIRNVLADAILDTEKTDWVAELKAMTAKIKQATEMAQTETDKVENTKPSHAIEDYTGTYAHPGYGKFDITLNGDSLIATLPIHKIQLKHHHYDIFEPFMIKDGESESLSPLFFNFYTDESGDISKLKLALEPALDPIEFKRTPFAGAVEKSDLEKLTGTYDLMGTKIRVFLNKAEKLILSVTGQPEFELIPVDKYNFSVKDLDGYKLEFVPTIDEDTVNEVKMIQPNGTFKAKRE